MSGISLVPVPVPPIGGGTVTVDDIAKIDCMAVPIHLYAQRIRFAECQFYGVFNQDQYVNKDTCAFWSQDERDDMEFYLREAQQMIEDEIGFFLCPQWTYGRIQDVPSESHRHVDAHVAESPLKTRWSKVISGGVRGVTVIDTNVGVVNASADPLVFSVATTVTNEDEIWVFHPSSTTRLYPSSVDISGGIVTVEIPRCRAVKEDVAADPPDGGIMYDVDSNFIATVDIYRVYNDTSTNAKLITPHTCSVSCGSGVCDEYSQDACIYVDDYDFGLVSLARATYSNGSWISSGMACCPPSIARLNYYSGLQSIDRELIEATYRLAHTLMPREPCGCDWVRNMWSRDMEQPNVTTKERELLPWGNLHGAWTSWMRIQKYKTNIGLSLM